MRWKGSWNMGNPMSNARVITGFVIVNDDGTISVVIQSPANIANEVRLTVEQHSSFAKVEERRNDFGYHMDAHAVFTEFMEYP
jgi:acylphosphatase